MLVKSNSNINSIRGAVMVEFILPFLTFFLLIAGIVDIGLTYYRFNLLVFVSQKVNREIAVNLGDNAENPTLIEAFARQRLIETFADFGHPVVEADINVGAANIDCTASNECYLELIDITWNSLSILGAFFWDEFAIKTSSRLLIEDRCYYEYN